MVTTKDLPLAI